MHADLNFKLVRIIYTLRKKKKPINTWGGYTNLWLNL